MSAGASPQSAPNRSEALRQPCSLWNAFSACRRRSRCGRCAAATAWASAASLAHSCAWAAHEPPRGGVSPLLSPGVAVVAGGASASRRA
eukprot:scaffold15239_cov73-Isochrysis_galbana.AAC.1